VGLWFAFCPHLSLTLGAFNEKKKKPCCFVLQSLRTKLGIAVLGSCEDPASVTWQAIQAALAHASPLATPAPFSHPSERALAVALLQLPETVEYATSVLQPHLLCDHLHSLAQCFHSFYSACRLLPGAAGDGGAHPSALQTRVALCAAADHALGTGLHLLGIAPTDRL
jgi:arginyl-tRNA synthetase